MPSLSVLREFKASFGEIGREKSDLESRSLPYHDIELPDTEAVAMPAEAPKAAEQISQTQEEITPDYSLPPEPGSGIMPGEFDTGAGIDWTAGAGDVDFSAFTNTVPSDFSADFSGELDEPLTDLEPLPDMDDLSAFPQEAAEAEYGASGDEFPTDIDSGTAADSGFDMEGFNFDTTPVDLDSESLDLGGEIPEPDMGMDFTEAPQETGSTGTDFDSYNLDSSEGTADFGDEILDLDGERLDLGGESLDTEESAPNFGIENNYDYGETDIESSANGIDGELYPVDHEDAGFEIDGDGFDIGGEAPAETSSADSFDTFSDSGNGEGDFDSNLDFNAGSEESDTGGADFTLPGIDDLFQGSQSGGAGKAAGGQIDSSDDVEEIQLSDEELERLKSTLSGYPLNLRIACEELIVEQAVAPDLMSKLIKLLVRGAPAKETAALAGKILNREIIIPRGFLKSTGEAMEAEQASFAYIFVHKFLPVFRLAAIIAVAAFCLCYLTYKFIYIPVHAEQIYKIGYERIFAGEYQRANERFADAFSLRRSKNWFYRYAEAFRDERQYLLAEQKYDELLRYYPRDKKGVLDYAALETMLRNYDKADKLLRRELLDYAPDDFNGLLALGDNSLAWGEIDRSKYEDARFAYARLLSKYGWKDPIVERMMKYFIRTDNLKEVLPLYDYFMNDRKRKISADSLAELGGYLLDKQLEEQRGVPNEYIEHITGVRSLLLRAVSADPSLPESHYHLARYYNNLGNTHEERITLEIAIKAFDNARQETVRRLNYRIDAHRRYANILTRSREFFAAEESLVRGINLYEDALARHLVASGPEFGKLYADLGDLEFFTKSGDWEQALRNYHRAELNGWAPPEIQYRMGSAYYQLENWKSALEYFFTASAELPLNRRLLFALGNASYQRGDYFASQGYFNRLLDILENERSRLPVLLPNDRPEYLELAERLMMARNNAGAAYEALAKQTGQQRYLSRAMALYAESSSAWDAMTRNPRTMIRSGSIALPQLNSRNTLYPQSNYEPRIFVRIDMDVLEPSIWEELVSPSR